MIEIRSPHRSEALELRAVRLRALEDAPIELGRVLAEGRVSFVAVANDRFVGMVGGKLSETDARVAELVALWVEPAARGSGVARRLVDAVVDWARRQGAAHVELWVVNGNDAARAVYERSGFRLRRPRAAGSMGARDERVAARPRALTASLRPNPR